jgi:hypothetical protein
VAVTVDTEATEEYGGERIESGKKPPGLGENAMFGGEVRPNVIFEV